MLMYVLIGHLWFNTHNHHAVLPCIVCQLKKKSPQIRNVRSVLYLKSIELNVKYKKNHLCRSINSPRSLVRGVLGLKTIEDPVIYCV